MSDDIVAELDRWLEANWDDTVYYDIKPGMLRRARDEIVALRKAVLSVEALDQIAEIARDEALEEAAQVCEARRDKTGPQDAYAVLDVQSYTSACDGCASDIRALKGAT